MNGCHGNGESRCRMLASIHALAAAANAANPDNDANVSHVCTSSSRFTQCQQKSLIRNTFLLVLARFVLSPLHLAPFFVILTGIPILC